MNASFLRLKKKFIPYCRTLLSLHSATGMPLLPESVTLTLELLVLQCQNNSDDTATLSAVFESLSRHEAHVVLLRQPDIVALLSHHGMAGRLVTAPPHTQCRGPTAALLLVHRDAPPAQLADAELPLRERIRDALHTLAWCDPSRPWVSLTLTPSANTPENADRLRLWAALLDRVGLTD